MGATAGLVVKEHENRETSLADPLRLKMRVGDPEGLVARPQQVEKHLAGRRIEPGMTLSALKQALVAGKVL